MQVAHSDVAEVLVVTQDSAKPLQYRDVCSSVVVGDFTM